MRFPALSIRFRFALHYHSIFPKAVPAWPAMTRVQVSLIVCFFLPDMQKSGSLTGNRSGRQTKEPAGSVRNRGLTLPVRVAQVNQEITALPTEAVSRPITAKKSRYLSSCRPCSVPLSRKKPHAPLSQWFGRLRPYGLWAGERRGRATWAGNGGERRERERPLVSS